MQFLYNDTIPEVLKFDMHIKPTYKLLLKLFYNIQKVV